MIIEQSEKLFIDKTIAKRNFEEICHNRKQVTTEWNPTIIPFWTPFWNFHKDFQ